MVKQNPDKQYLFKFDEQGTNEVSQQIMNSYNTGFIDQSEDIRDRENPTVTEG
ncbi:hypothetical protein [Neobacillus fumarioli]|uniref:hypothetical protein n=1 Tax=Neobacillus fumarioli TaxID=105229 RepID=UPI000A947FCD|nr:hypothetical protein [Neobacillus fumarioli]